MVNSANLTRAEIGVIQLLLQGLSNKAMAATLVVSIRTIESHISHALMKTGCRSRLELVLWWMRQPTEPHGQPIGKLPSMPA